MTEPYTPTTGEVRKRYTQGRGGRYYSNSGFVNPGAEFDRWYVQEIEKAEYSGYLRAVREGLHL